MKALLILSFFLTFQLLNAQSPREFTIELASDNYEITNSIFLDDDGNFIMTIQEEVGGDFLGKVIKIDITGKLIWESENIDIANSVEDVLIVEDDRLLLAGHSPPYMLLTTLTRNGELLKIDTFTHPAIDRQFTNAFVVLNNQYVIISNGFNEENQVSLYQYYINENLELDTIIVTNNGSNNQHAGVEINSEGNLIVVQSWDVPFEAKRLFKMVEYTSPRQSQEIWFSGILSTFSTFINEFTIDNDGNFYLPAGNLWLEGEPPPIDNEKGINAYSSNGQFKWRYAFDDNGFDITISDIMSTNNGDIVCVGNAWEISEGGYAWISRISSDGDLLWERNYRKMRVGSRNEFQGHFSDVEELNDSTIVVAGRVRQQDRIDTDGSRHRNDDLWVMLLDEDGCAYSGCDDFIITDTKETLSPADDELGINIFPNPSTGLFVFESDEEIRSIQVFDFSGGLIKKLDLSTGERQHSIDLRYEANGVYTVLFEGKNGKTQAERLIKLD